MTSGLDKYALISLPDAELLRRCRCEACRGTGPGGQKRNKTSSAVRLTHLDSGIAVVDDATRSQHLNLANALRKLRLELSVALPAPIAAPPQPPLEPVPRTHSAAHALWVAALYDLLQANGFQLPACAAALGCSPSRLAKVLSRDIFLWQRISQQRQRLGLPPLNH